MVRDWTVAFIFTQQTDWTRTVRSSADWQPTVQFHRFAIMQFDYCCCCCCCCNCMKGLLIEGKYLSDRPVYLSDERKRPLGTSVCRWEYNIERDFKGILWEDVEWTGLDWTGLDWTGLDWTGQDWTELDWAGLDRLSVKDNWRAAVNTFVILRASYSPGNICDSLKNCGFSRRASTARSYFKINVMTSLLCVLHVLYDFGSVR